MTVTVLPGKLCMNGGAYTPDLTVCILAMEETRKAVTQNFLDALLSLFDYKRKRGRRISQSDRSRNPQDSHGRNAGGGLTFCAVMYRMICGGLKNAATSLRGDTQRQRDLDGAAPGERPRILDTAGGRG